MNAIILAGGFATRLYPLTENYPKALLKIGSKPIIEFVLDDLRDTPHISRYLLVTNSRYAPHFSKWLQEYSFPSKIELLNNGIENAEERNGAIGDLVKALEVLPSDDTLILASDTLISEPITTFIRQAHDKQIPATMLIDLYDKDRIANKLGCVELNEQHIIIDFEEKPPHPKTTLAAVPYYYLPKTDLQQVNDYMKTDLQKDAPGSFFRWLSQQTKVFGYVIENGYYLDIGTKEALDQANQLIDKKLY